ncbi:MAG: cation:proton antiporter [Oscillospiraceae bacterium]|nr:cation:proton antiporter [Oscillospiraceae bacterium]
MEEVLICLALAMICGLLMTRVAKIFHLPAVTAYLVTGILLGPFCLGSLGIEGLGFTSLEEVDSFSIISQVALAFIAFLIGNEFKVKELKEMGKQAITVGILQAVVTTVVVDIGLIALHFIFPEAISLPAAITLGAIASATAPAATLMVVNQYKAHGPLTKLLLMVVAIDDAVGLVLFSVSYGIADALEQGRVSVVNIVLEPVIEIALSIILGVLMGLLLRWFEKFFKSRANRMSMSIGVVVLAAAVSMTELEVGGVKIGFSLLLTCMITGAIFCNTSELSGGVMENDDRWTSALNVLFFVISGAELDLSILTQPLVLLVGITYIIFRSCGKIFGAFSSTKMTGCSPEIQKYLGITLLPQAGVALGMATTAANLQDGALIRNVVLFSVMVYELVGPTLTKIALKKAGEIDPDADKKVKKAAKA